jgi:cation transport regulator ChaC
MPRSASAWRTQLPERFPPLRAGDEFGVDYVFGYGSLTWDGRCPVHQAELRDTRRVWGVAMDNTEDIPGYKHYLRRGDGSRPEVCVAFLDLEPAVGESVNGICLEATPERLAELDRRERNYVRVDVTERLSPRPPGRTWVYVGRPESRARLRRARSRSRAVVSQEYREHVLRGFAGLGREALVSFRRSTEWYGLPVVDLVRVDHGRPQRAPA